MMGKKFVLFALAVITSIAAVSVHGAETKKEKLVKKAKGEKKVADVVWQKDVAKAIAAAKKSKKPILLVHIAPKVNNNSELYDKNIIKNKNLNKFSKDFIFVKFEYKDLKNISKEAAAALKKYPLEKQRNTFVMPTVYLLDSTGAVIEKKAGYYTELSPSEYFKSFKSLKKLKKK